MKKIINFFKPNLKLVRGTRLSSALFIGASLALAAGIIFGANIYYDIDTSKIMVDDAQQATTTQITVNTGNTTALTVTQRGTAAAFSATSTSAMTSDIFKITNLGSGQSFVVEDSDTDSSPFIITRSGSVGVGTTTLFGLLTVGTTTPSLVVASSTYVGIATTSPSEQFAVQGNIIGSGNIVVYGSNVTSTFTSAIQAANVRLTAGANTNYVLTSDTNGFANWQSLGTLAPNSWQYIGPNAIRPTSTVGIIVSASSTFAGDLSVGTTTSGYPLLYIDTGINGQVGIGTSTLSTNLLTVGTTTSRLVVANNGYVGISTSTPSDILSVGGNIIGSGNLIVYGASTSTFGGGIRTNGDIAGTGGALSIYLTSAGALTLQPQSDSNVLVQLGGAGQLKIGSTGQFYIDASGNATTSGNIYASGFFTTGNSATVRKTGDEIVRGVAPILGFDLPAQCNTSCLPPSWATTTRTIENTDFFPPAYPGTTRKYRFSIRYASASSSAAFVWQIATSSDNVSSQYQFTLNATGYTDINKGFSTTTNLITSLPANNVNTCGSSPNCWLLRTQSPPTNGGYNFRVYEVLLIGVDQVN